MTENTTLLPVNPKHESGIPKLRGYNEGRGQWGTTGNLVGIAAKMNALLYFIFAS